MASRPSRPEAVAGDEETEGEGVKDGALHMAKLMVLLFIMGFIGAAAGRR